MTDTQRDTSQPPGSPDSAAINGTEAGGDTDRLRTEVKQRYGAIAQGVLGTATTSGCCGTTVTVDAPAPLPEDAESGSGCCGPATATWSDELAAAVPTSRPGDDPISRGIYDDEQASQLPEAALLASLGCGNPTALAQLHDGETVLDLGSGGGIDVLLSARRVGQAGFAYGLDMTDEMLELAERNRVEAGATNVKFLKGHIEEIPLPDDHVDVVISNCVINLSADKPRVFREIFRVLKPGGRVAVSDIVVRGSIDPAIRASAEAWVGCVAGALEEGDYRSGLSAAGFTDIDIEPTRTFTPADAAGFIEASGLDPGAVADAASHIVSAFIRATKPIPQA